MAATPVMVASVATVSLVPQGRMRPSLVTPEPMAVMEEMAATAVTPEPVVSRVLVVVVLRRATRATTGLRALVVRQAMVESAETVPMDPLVTPELRYSPTEQRVPPVVTPVTEATVVSAVRPVPVLVEPMVLVATVETVVSPVTAASVESASRA